MREMKVTLEVNWSQTNSELLIVKWDVVTKNDNFWVIFYDPLEQRFSTWGTREVCRLKQITKCLEVQFCHKIWFQGTEVQKV